MKIKTISIITSITLALSTLFAGCDLLQSNLSSTMEEALAENTGVASVASKYWYYNGQYSDDMSVYSEKLSDKYFDQSLLVSFTKKVAGSPKGSIEIKYTDKDGDSASKTFSSISGTFCNDYYGYKVDMSDVMSLFDTETIPSGTASMTIKVSGFICAEGDQAGRSLSSLEVKNIQIKPLFKNNSVDFSTKGFSSSSVIEFDLNGDINLDGNNYTISGTDSDGTEYDFTVSASGSSLQFTPGSKFDFSDLETLKDNLDGESITLPLKNILPLTAGDSYSSSVTINFTKYSIVIDGKKDENFTAANGASVETDASGDTSAYGESHPDYASSISQGTDIQEVSVTSDEYYLYVAVSGNLAVTWNDALVVMISNGDYTTSSSAANGNGFYSADVEKFGYSGRSGSYFVQPNVYLVHQPGLNNTGSGSLSAHAYVSSSNQDISSSVKYSPEGWTSDVTKNFVEYAIPLSQAGLSSGDTVNVLVVSSLQWSDGKAAADCSSDAAVYEINGDHTEVTYDLAKALEYTIE